MARRLLPLRIDKKKLTFVWRVCSICGAKYTQHFPHLAAAIQFQELDGETVCPTDRRRAGLTPALPPPDVFNPALNIDEHGEPMDLYTIYLRTIVAAGCRLTLFAKKKKQV